MATTWQRAVWGLGLSGGLLLLAVLGGGANGQEKAAKPAGAKAAVTEAQAMFFEKNVRPLLIASCYPCHGDKNPQAGLQLNSLAAMLKGSAAGPALVAGDPEKSALIHAVRYDGLTKMPPSGKLKPQEIAALNEWVKMGAPWPGTTAADAQAPAKKEYEITPAQRNWWAFRPIARPALPKVTDTKWAKNPLDRFILARLEAKKLQPAPPADRRSLLRRVTFDLTGLPPTPGEIAAFLSDASPNAYARVVDRLLASPHYGERWGRHWLDVARYADSNGQDENLAFGYAFRYRDYVIAALNKDKPYDRFVQEQLAGDLLPAPDEATRNENLTATGFLTLGAKVLAEQDKPKLVMDVIDEQIEVTSKAFLGLTVACARCHDHKFDPIPTKDYYALAGIFKSTRTMEHLGFVSKWMERPLTTKAREAEVAAYQTATLAPLEKMRDAARDAANKQVAASKGGKLPEKPEEFYTKEAKASLDKAEADLKAAQDKGPKIEIAMAVEDAKPENVRVHIRGNTQTLGDEVPRHFLAIASDVRQTQIAPGQSGRLELARWITNPNNPLTARVAVNRVWQEHFGQGLSASPDNFGKRGEAPTHPELLDWLAGTFVQNGWSLKKLHRLILLSSAYQMSTQTSARATLVDPDNRLLSHANRRRLEAEPFRDAMLAVSDKIDLTLNGSLLGIKDGDYVSDDQSRNGGHYDALRRSIYLPIIRNALFDMFQAFDFGDPSTVTAKRASTTVAPQALYVMNSPFVMNLCQQYAGELLADAKQTDTSRLDTAYVKAFGRPPTPTETQRALVFLNAYGQKLRGKQPDDAKRRQQTWAALCQILFASNEFIYLN